MAGASTRSPPLSIRNPPSYGRCVYSITAASADAVTVLENGSPANERVSANSYEYFKFYVTLPSADVEFVLSAFSGTTIVPRIEPHHRCPHLLAHHPCLLPRPPRSCCLVALTIRAPPLADVVW
jgi:hypothetical protein